MDLLMGVNSNPMLGISLLNCLLVFIKSDLQGPLGFTNVGVVVVLAWDLEDHAPPSLVWVTGLDLHQGLSEGCQWLECSPDTKWGADTFQLFTEPSDVREARDRGGGGGHPR